MVLSASPSCARPISALSSFTTLINSCKFSSIGSGSRPGKNPSACALRVVTSQPNFLIKNGAV